MNSDNQSTKRGPCRSCGELQFHNSKTCEILIAKGMWATDVAMPIRDSERFVLDSEREPTVRPCRECGEVEFHRTDGENLCPLVPSALMGRKSPVHDSQRIPDKPVESGRVCVECGHDALVDGVCRQQMPPANWREQVGIPLPAICGHKCTFPESEQIEWHEFRPTPPLTEICGVIVKGKECNRGQYAEVHAPAEPPQCEHSISLTEDYVGAESQCPIHGETVPAPQDSELGAFWRLWFARVGEHATVDLVNATAELVLAERDSASTNAPQAVADELARIIKWMNDRDFIAVNQALELLRIRESVNRIEATRTTLAHSPAPPSIESALAQIAHAIEGLPTIRNRSEVDGLADDDQQYVDVARVLEIIREEKSNAK